MTFFDPRISGTGVAGFAYQQLRTRRAIDLPIISCRGHVAFIAKIVVIGIVAARVPPKFPRVGLPIVLILLATSCSRSTIASRRCSAAMYAIGGGQVRGGLCRKHQRQELSPFWCYVNMGSRGRCWRRHRPV